MGFGFPNTIPVWSFWVICLHLVYFLPTFELSQGLFVHPCRFLPTYFWFLDCWDWPLLSLEETILNIQTESTSCPGPIFSLGPCFMGVLQAHPWAGQSLFSWCVVILLFVLLPPWQRITSENGRERKQWEVEMKTSIFLTYWYFFSYSSFPDLPCLFICAQNFAYF